MKTAILTDSTAYITEDERKEYGIHMVPLNVIFGDVTYQEETDLTTEEFYTKVKEAKELPKTSQPSVGVIMEKIEELKQKYDDVIAITLSSGISGTYQAMRSARGHGRGSVCSRIRFRDQLSYAGVLCTGSRQILGSRDRRRRNHLPPGTNERNDACLFYSR